MTERKLGPNMKRLLAMRVAREAIPAGGGIADGMNFLLDRQRMIETSRKALEWCDLAVTAIRSAPDNPYGNDEEAIAGAILANAENSPREENHEGE